MNQRTVRRVGRSAPGALLLTLVLAGQTVAATWNSPFALSSSGLAHTGGLVTLGSSTVVAAYVETDPSWIAPDKLFVRRSTNSGASWQQPLLLTSDGSFPALAGRGSSVDIVWNRANGRLRYARSTDSGASFGSSIALSPSGRYAWRPSVARGIDGRVAVAWIDAQSGAVNVRVSTNGGASFAPAKVIATADDGAGTAVAIGTRAMFVAYTKPRGTKVRVKRSLDSGVTWSAAARITDNSWGDSVSLTAAGSQAYVAYSVASPGMNFFQVRYRRTTDSGASWSSQASLAPSSWETTSPHISLKGGVVRVVFERCSNNWDYCDNYRILYRQSSDGTSWTTAQQVSPRGLEAWQASVGFASNIVVTYTGEGADDVKPYVRVGTP